jgi:hypothetical protein
MLRLPYRAQPVNDVWRNSRCLLRETEREREIEFGGAVRDTTKLCGGGVGNSSCCLEGSQALPASPSDRVGFDFRVKNNLKCGVAVYCETIRTTQVQFIPHRRHITSSLQSRTG